jgi:cyanophycin synthetase
MISNVLSATLAAYTYGFTIEDIKTNLESFIPSASQTPGRMNIFDFKEYKVLIDFAHNPDGFRGIKEFLSSIESPYKIGIITGTGDRRDDDIRDLGRISAEMFDHIIIRQDKHLRGRAAEEMVQLLVEGINESKTREIPITIIYNEKEAIMHAYNTAKTGSLITIMCDVVSEALDLIKDMKEKEDAETA